MLELSKKTFIASILFLDIVGYSKYSVELQLEIKDHLNQTIGDAIAKIPEADRILLDTGDGAALCFLSSPEEALGVALAIRDGIEASDNPVPGEYRLCMGINLGPVRVINDINGQRNVIGDGINAAQRVLSFAASGQILVSRGFHDIVAFLTAQNMELFRYYGVHHDKHGREHEVYEVAAGSGVEPVRPLSPAGVEPTRTSSGDEGPRADGIALSAEALEIIEQHYARYVGPIAHVLVGRMLGKASSLREACERLKELVSDEQDKVEFEQGFCHALADQASNDALQPPLTPSTSSVSEQGQGSAGGWAPERIEQLEQHLTRFIGPIAKIVIKREARGAVNFSDLCQRLAGHIEIPQERERFLHQVNGV